MNQSIMLNECQIDEIRKLAKAKRQSLSIIGEIPIANDIFTILEQLNIKLLEYPIQSEGDGLAFSAAIMCSEEDGEELVFIGLNTADYFDKQIFAIAHELFHYFTKTASHLSRLGDIENTLIEAKANRFAAEFLFPEAALKSIILDEFKTSKLEKVAEKTILRFIARLQCTWWLPYHSIVKRLHEIGAISEEQYGKLYGIDERDLYSEYGKMGMAFNEEVFKKLNSKTNSIGTSMRDIDIIIRNFEDGLINEDKLTVTLGLFNKSPDDFGYRVNVSNEDEEEFDAFFSGGSSDED
ncbi:ImmA/IrrE family metallo-endopeptidase [Acetivibrio cellulolyticus]|uniref:ImmA/IrrE family metallo-endopeptidase n=1 Tax=Acetivibrio cellulolyticus TaxID=35830 RepID=UPI0001E2D97F|nr:ImmA/IrrE family metallo-endopeptidase [Acetivibrio cellulolyticus]